MDMHPDLEQVLFSRERIAARVAELGRQISDDYRNGNLLLVGVLKGAVVFLADLMRAITIPHRFDFIRASSYGKGTTSSGYVMLSGQIEHHLADYDVLIVEGIVDTGRTIEALTREFTRSGARSLEVCSFLMKKRARAVPVVCRYLGYEVPDRFVVGYGLDYDERYRHLDCVGILRREVYEL